MRPGTLLTNMYGKKAVYTKKEAVAAMTAYLDIHAQSQENDVDESEISTKYDKFLNWFNTVMGGNGYQNKKSTIYQQNKNRFRARINEGYTAEDFKKALKNIRNDNYHKDTGYKFVTPEFLMRPNIMERFKNIEVVAVTEKPIYTDKEGRPVYQGPDGRKYVMGENNTKIIIS